MPDVVLPRLPEDLSAGTLLRWHRASGDLVQRGDALADAGAGTDADFVTLEADAAGTLEIVVPTGGEVAPGAVVAHIHPAGRAAAGAATTTAKGEVAVTEPTRAQQQIARRAAESRATVPTYDIEVEVDATALLTLRDRLGASDPTPTITDLVVKACGLALVDHPQLNAGYRDARFERFSRVNVGIQVDVPGGIVVPTVFDADRRDVREIAAESRGLATRAREGSITPPELSGATFTVSNLGMLGVRRFAAIVTPPQAAVLAVGEIASRPVVRDGGIVARETASLTLTCDHRIVYGAEAARFLARLAALIENPDALSS